MFLFHPSIVFLFHRYTISSYLTEVINDLIFIIIIKSFILCELSLLLMCNSELQKTKSLVWSWWGLRYDYFVGSFPWGLIVLVFLRFSFRLIRFPRKTDFCLEDILHAWLSTFWKPRLGRRLGSLNIPYAWFHFSVRYFYCLLCVPCCPSVRESLFCPL